MSKSASFQWSPVLTLLVLLAAMLAILLLIIFNSNQNQQLVSDEGLLMPDSALNVDTLQITAPPFYFNQPKAGAVWTYQVANRMMLLQSIDKNGHWGSFNDYYHKILGVLVSQEEAPGSASFTFYYVQPKFNWELWKKIPQFLKAKHPQQDFSWN